MPRYLADFADRLNLSIQYDTEISGIKRNRTDQILHMKDQKHNLHSCRYSHLISVAHFFSCKTLAISEFSQRFTNFSVNRVNVVATIVSRYLNRSNVSVLSLIPGSCNHYGYWHLCQRARCK